MSSSEQPAPEADQSPGSLHVSALEWWTEHSAALDGISPRRQAFNQAIVRAVNASDVWLRRHWLAGGNTGLGLFIGLAVAAPRLRTFGPRGVGQAILASHHRLLAQ